MVKVWEEVRIMDEASLCVISTKQRHFAIIVEKQSANVQNINLSRRYDV